MTVTPKVEMKYGPYRFAAEYKYSHYDSFEGGDRRGNLTNDFHLVDTREAYKFSCGRLVDFIDVAFLKTHPIWAEAEVRRSIRTGFIADDEVTHAGGNTWFMLRFSIIL